MPETHHHSGSQAVALALREVLPVPTRTRVYTLTCGCPAADGQRFWNIDTETRSYELVLVPDRPGLQAAQLTSTPRCGDGAVWTAEFLVRDSSDDWAQPLAQLVARLTLADRSPLSLPG
ncbi:hypothetical protein OG800_49560 (plasmid) [Streptomyces sp. NBC_00445]|uniref:hypothetical protein n=1 Tax=Streptomyces sp. NBC_00445 TaxID=2975745 RepID=UPI002E1DCFD5